MKIKEAKAYQLNSLNKLCQENGIIFDDLNKLLESVKTKKLLKRNNYHQQKINDIIDKTTK